MKNDKINTRLDLYMTLLIGFFLIISFSFSYLNLGESIENFIMLTVLMIIALVSYYLNKTLALIISMVVIFLYSTYRLYFSLKDGVDIGFSVIYWVVLIPITALILSFIGEVILNIQEKILELERKSEELIMVDEVTGIRNFSAFMNEMPIYMNLYKRYEMPITLILVRIKYSERLERIIGNEDYNQIIVRTSDTLKEVLRFEDRKYLVNKNTFAYIIISDEKGSKIVKDRMRKVAEELSFGKEKLYKDINLEIQIGSYTETKDVKDSMEFLSLAERELDYDV